MKPDPRQTAEYAGVLSMAALAMGLSALGFIFISDQLKWKGQEDLVLLAERQALVHVTQDDLQLWVVDPKIDLKLSSARKHSLTCAETPQLYWMDKRTWVALENRTEADLAILCRILNTPANHARNEMNEKGA